MNSVAQTCVPCNGAAGQRQKTKCWTVGEQTAYLLPVRIGQLTQDTTQVKVVKGAPFWKKEEIKELLTLDD